MPLNSTFKTHLGCYNNRKQQLKKLAKITAARLTQQYAQDQINASSQAKTGFRK